jgi:hypothetical protein
MVVRSFPLTNSSQVLLLSTVLHAVESVVMEGGGELIMNLEVNFMTADKSWF